MTLRIDEAEGRFKPALRSRSARRSTVPDDSADETDHIETATTTASTDTGGGGFVISVPTRSVIPVPAAAVRPPRAPEPSPTTTQDTQAEGDKKTTKRRRKKAVVEDPQALEPLDWATTPMKAFCKDTERGIPMDKAAESTRARNRKRQRTNQTAEIKAEEVAPRGMASMGPQIRINAKGERVLDESSLIISHTQLTNEPEIDLDDIIEETADTQLTNYGSYARRIKPGRWNDESTHLFFKGLFLYGTDFEMVAQMLFPSLSRTNIKNKFKREEKKDPDRITRALLRRDEDLRLECLGNVVKAQVEEDELPSVELKQP